MYSCTLHRGAERDASYITFLDPKSDYVLNTNMGKQVERGQSIERGPTKGKEKRIEHREDILALARGGEEGGCRFR